MKNDKITVAEDHGVVVKGKTKEPTPTENPVRITKGSGSDALLIVFACVVGSVLFSIFFVFVLK